MKRRRFDTHRAKWAGLTVAVLLIACMFLPGNHVLSFGTVTQGTMYDPVMTYGVTLSGKGVTWETVEVFDPGVPNVDYLGPFVRFEQRYDKYIFSGWFDWDELLMFGLTCQYVHLPLWPLAIALAVATVWFFRVDRRSKAWQCAKCRYDLRGLEGNGDGGAAKVVCPECGLAKGEG